MSTTRLLKARLACPFARFNRGRYFQCNCHDLADYEAMKTHVKRKHIQSDFYCPLCFTFFETHDARDEHIVQTRTGNPCPMAVGFDEIPIREWNDIMSDEADPCPRTSNCVVKWLWFWRRFFRHVPAPSPELVYLRDIDVEARDFSANAEIIQSVLDMSPVGSSAQLGQRIREALLHPSPGPRQYRRYQGSNAPAPADVPAPRPDQQSEAEGSHDPVLHPLAPEQLPGEPSQSLGEPLPRQVLDLRVPWPSAPERVARVSNEGAPTVEITIPWSSEDVRQRIRDEPIFYFSREGPRWRDIEDWVDWDDMQWKGGRDASVSVSLPRGRYDELVEMSSRELDPYLHWPDALADDPEARG